MNNLHVMVFDTVCSLCGDGEIKKKGSDANLSARLWHFQSYVSIQLTARSRVDNYNIISAHVHVCV